MTHAVSADGTRIAVERSGSGTPLVLVHGSATDARQWDGVRAALPAGYEVFAMTRRGRGGSDPGDLSLAAQGEDVRAVLALAGPDAIVLAHSFGARCVLEALVGGAPAGRAVLYEPLVGAEVATMGFDLAIVEELASLERMGDADAALRYFVRHVTRTPDAAVERMARTAVWHVGLASVGTLAEETRVALTDAVGAADLARVRVPVRLLVGERTLPHFRLGAERYAELLPDAELVTVPGEGHLGVELAPAKVVAAALSSV